MDMSCNCLPEGETLDKLIRRNCAVGFDLRFCRSVAVAEDERMIKESFRSSLSLRNWVTRS